MPRTSSGAVLYPDIERNHVVAPGRGPALQSFVGATYKGMSHKQKNAHSSNSEDALTWSCFDVLDQISDDSRRQLALQQIWEDSFTDPALPFPPDFAQPGGVTLHVGKKYSNAAGDTEIDASFEAPALLVFFEAKLYSTISLGREGRPHDQIAHKLRVGLEAAGADREFYFIFLDLAPYEQLTARHSKDEASDSARTGYHNKWKSAWWYRRYKKGAGGHLTPLTDALAAAPPVAAPGGVQQVADRMGWLTWADLFKIVLRAKV